MFTHPKSNSFKHIGIRVRFVQRGAIQHERLPHHVLGQAVRYSGPDLAYVIDLFGHVWIAIGTATPRKIFDRFVMMDSGSIIDRTEVPGQRVIHLSEDYVVCITDEVTGSPLQQSCASIRGPADGSVKSGTVRTLLLPCCPLLF